MAAKKFGFDLMREQLLMEAETIVDFFSHHAKGDSEIERLFAASCVCFGQICGNGHKSIMRTKDEMFKAVWQDMDEANVKWLVLMRQQVVMEFGRVDFVFSAFSPTEKEWKHLVVECDGHDFHERTKEQAAKDKSRDRAAVLSGYTCFRFTGSELWGDPLGCAQQVAQWADKVWEER